MTTQGGSAQQPTCERCGKVLPESFLFVRKQTPGFGNGDELDTQQQRSSTVINRAQQSVRLREIAGASSPDHHIPSLCSPCTENVARVIKEQNKVEEKDRVVYAKALEELKANTTLATLGANPVTEEDVKAMEEKAMKEYHEAQERWERIRRETEAMDQKEKELNNAEEDHWTQFGVFTEAMQSLKDEEDRWVAESVRIKELTRAVSEMNIGRELFKINMSGGNVGKINECRLGRPQDIGVELEEINAAWGYAALLMARLEHNLHMKFSVYRVVPFGFRSYLRVMVSLSLIHISQGIVR